MDWPLCAWTARWYPPTGSPPAPSGHHLWYSGKHHAFGGSVQVLTDPTGFPLWISAVRPGSTHDLTAARELVLPALCPHAARGLPLLADKGYTGAGIGVHVPVRHQPDGPLHTNNRCYNALITALRASIERGNALLGRWRTLDRVTVCPQRIGAIAAAALVLTRTRPRNQVRKPQYGAPLGSGG